MRCTRGFKTQLKQPSSPWGSVVISRKVDSLLNCLWLWPKLVRASLENELRFEREAREEVEASLLFFNGIFDQDQSLDIFHNVPSSPVSYTETATTRRSPHSQHEPNFAYLPSPTIAGASSSSTQASSPDTPIHKLLGNAKAFKSATISNVASATLKTPNPYLLERTDFLKQSSTSRSGSYPSPSTTDSSLVGQGDTHFRDEAVTTKGKLSERNARIFGHITKRPRSKTPRFKKWNIPSQTREFMIERKFPLNRQTGPNPNNFKSTCNLKRIVFDKQTLSFATVEELIVSCAFLPGLKKDAIEKKAWTNSLLNIIEGLQAWKSFVQEAESKPLVNQKGKLPSSFPISCLANKLWTLKREMLRCFGVPIAHPDFNEELSHFTYWLVQEIENSSMSKSDIKRNENAIWFSIEDIYDNFYQRFEKSSLWQARLKLQDSFHVIFQDEAFLAWVAINIIGLYYKSTNEIKWTSCFPQGDKSFIMLLEEIMTRLWCRNSKLYSELDLAYLKLLPWVKETKIPKKTDLEKLDFPQQPTETIVFESHILKLQD
ncbi:hypothetical protein O181_046455 [Austropuccinia psidii MF-1]|uniref:Uncharacterized protein n=1 Tax=Austropuccinia psidii MF-1 TaxID=1389203 RepID=A0A9Q3HM77_9BASI|nr:hypothetical protein [Austropuccinia psidii MF-1]